MAEANTTAAADTGDEAADGSRTVLRGLAETPITLA